MIEVHMQNHREIQTVMHEVKMRELTVKKTEFVNPHIKRITFTSPELKDFKSLSPDDHVKVFFNKPGEDKIMRDYTPRRFDKDALELDLEFFLHGNGPGSKWAIQAEPGQKIVIGGPRGSKIVPYHYDWYLMVGDETSLPSFSRRLSEMPSDAKALVFLEVQNDQDKVELTHNGNAQIFWITRDSGASIEEAVKNATFPQGDFFSWVSLEKRTAMDLKDYLIIDKNINSAWVKATGYWTR